MQSVSACVFKFICQVRRTEMDFMDRKLMKDSYNQWNESSKIFIFMRTYARSCETNEKFNESYFIYPSSYDMSWFLGECIELKLITQTNRIFHMKTALIFKLHLNSCQQYQHPLYFFSVTTIYAHKKLMFKVRIKCLFSKKEL